MFRPILSLLPALAACLPALAGMPAGLSLGEKEKDVLQKVAASDDFTPLNDKAKRRLEGNYSLKAKVAGQQWNAHFIFDRRSKILSQLLFVSDKPMQANQYNKLLKSFYIFTVGHLREHFKLQEPLNLPDFGHAGSLKEKEMFPLHAFPGDDIMLTAGLWKSDIGIHLCFTVQPSSNSALGQTYTANTSGKQADWDNVPAFASTEQGKAFLEETGLAPAPEPAKPKGDELAEEDESLFDEVEESTESTQSGIVTASDKLPQEEQDILNALIMLHNSKPKEGLALLINAAQAGNARALYELGCGYAEGKYGLAPDSKNADNAFRKSAVAGFALALVRFGAEFPLALETLGFRALDGKNMVKSAEESGPMSPSRRFNYAVMLRYGYGVRKDTAKAAEMMQQLAGEGDPVAARLAEEWAE